MIEHDHDLDILPFWHELVVKKLINKQEISAELHDELSMKMWGSIYRAVFKCAMCCL